MIQVFHGRSQDADTSSAARYLCPFSPRRFTNSLAQCAVPVPIDTTLQNLFVTIQTAPGAGKSWTFTIFKNGVATGLTVTISDANTSAADVVNTVSVTDGDLIALRRTGAGTPTSYADTGVWIESDSAAANESFYASNDAIGWGGGSLFKGLFGADDGFLGDSGGRRAMHVAPLSGSITKMRVQLESAIGASNTPTLVIVKNNTDQDGAGGTPDTRIAPTSGGGTSYAATFTCAIAPGDTGSLKIFGTYVSGAGGRYQVSVKVVADVDGEFVLAGNDDSVFSTSAVNYASPCQGPTLDFLSVTEADVVYTCGPTSIYVDHVYLSANGSPGAGDAYTVAIRRNASTPAGTPTIVLADANTAANDVAHSVALSSGDTWALECTPAGTPAALRLFWGLRATAIPPGGGSAIVPVFDHHYRQMGMQ